MEILKCKNFINEQELIDIDTNTVNSNAHKAFEKYFNDNHDKFSIDGGETNYADIYKSKHDLDESNCESEINEKTFNKTKDIKSVVDTLKSRYKMKDYQFKVYEPFKVEIVEVYNVPDFLQMTNAIIMKDIKEDTEAITSEMEEAGYYLVREFKYVDKVTSDNCVMLVYDPVVQEDITGMVKYKYMYLYHCSPIKNKKSILEKGLFPTRGARLYKYPDARLYLHLGNLDTNSFKKMMRNVTISRKKDDPTFDGKYAVFEIRSSTLPDSIKFYYDPHGEDCIYTNSVILPRFFRFLEEVHF